MRFGLRYYCPPGVARPAHRDDLSPAACCDGKGPDVASGGPGGGMVYGGVYADGEPGWTLTSAGWWLHVGDALPQQLIRVETPRELVRWVEVGGVGPADYWRVPVLITRARGEPGQAGVVYVSALERTWRGPDAGWTDDSRLKPLQERLLAVAHGIALSGDLSAENASLTAIVCEGLAIGHRISPIEIAAAGWLTERVLLRVAMAMGDLGVIEQVAP